VRRSPAPKGAHAIRADAIRPDAAAARGLAAFAINLIHDWQCSRGIWVAFGLQVRLQVFERARPIRTNRNSVGLEPSAVRQPIRLPCPGGIQRHPVGPVGFMTQDTTQSQSAYCEIGLAVAPLQPQDWAQAVVAFERCPLGINVPVRELYCPEWPSVY
jgi:hypothetical protein